MDLPAALIPAAKGDSQRIESAVASRGNGNPLRLLHTFWLLQPGRWYDWAAIWMLQNLRFAPIYLLPLLVGKVIDSIDRAHPEKVYAWLPWLVGATAVLCVVNVIGDSTGRLLLSRISRGLTASLRDALVKRLNRLQLGFHDREHVGDMQTRFTLDMSRLESFLAFIADSILMNASVIIVMSVIIVFTNPALLLIIGVGAVLNLILAKVIWSRLGRAQEAFRAAEGNFLHRLGETLAGMRLSRAHATEKFTEERLRADTMQVARSGMTLDFLMNLFGSASWAIGTMLNTAVIAFGVWLIVTDPHTFNLWGASFTIKPITLGEFTILLSYYGIVSGALAAIVNQVPSVTGAHDAMRSLTQLYHQEDIEAPRGRHRLTKVSGRISLNGVSFTYPGNPAPTLQNLTLDIPVGSSLALVGPSGGGKSTVASLILGFYPIDRGAIVVDGHDIDQIDLRSFRQHVGVVNQEVVLFNDSILNNIAWGDRKPDRSKVLKAAELANASEFIDALDGGLDHVLGDAGKGLSGGQRQRLAIARALYRDPRILILDEATSALDTASEHLVQEALQRSMKGRTTIIIAHRLSTIRNVDHVAVIADGTIAESGKFDQLAAQDGIFAEMLRQHDTHAA